LDTYFIGQNSAANDGGDYNIISGSGGTNSGNTNIFAGAGTDNVGGDIEFSSGDGLLNGGFFGIIAGTAINNTGSDVTFSAGDSNTILGLAGNIYLNAGSGGVLGSVTVASAASVGIIAQIFVSNSFLELQDEVTGDELLFQADSSSIIEFNGFTIIRSLADFPVLYPDTGIAVDANTQYSEMRKLQNSFNTLLNDLGQCQHGLIQTFKADGVTPSACADLSDPPLVTP